MRTGISPKVREQLALNCVNICTSLNINVPLQSLEERQAQENAHKEERRKRNCANAKGYYYAHREELLAEAHTQERRKRYRANAKNYYLAHREEILAKRREQYQKQKQNIN